MAAEQKRCGSDRRNAAQARETRRAALGRLGAVALAIAVALVLAPAARAVPVTMTDGNSTVLIDPESSAGIYDWTIGGTSHLAQQWFWFRASVDGWNDREYSIDTIGTPVVTQPVPNLATLTYTDSQGRFAIETMLILAGGDGFHAADLAEIVKVINLSNDPITFTLFEYGDYNLAGDPVDVSLKIAGGNTAEQAGIGDWMIAEMHSVVTGPPDLCEAATYSDTLDKLEDADIDNLNNVLAAGAGDCTWAFEWLGREVDPLQALIISRDTIINTEPVAEPGSFALLVLGLGGIVRLKRRK